MVSEKNLQTEIDLTSSRVTILGLPGSGKTMLSKHILRQTTEHLVYDPMHEYGDYISYTPDDMRDPHELNDFIWEQALPRAPSLFVIDEVNACVKKNPSPLPDGVFHLTNFNRHHGMAFIAIARRPSQIHTDLIETSHYLMVFNLTGNNDIKTLNNTFRGMGEAVRSLDEYHFAVLEKGKKLTIHEPITIIDSE